MTGEIQPFTYKTAKQAFVGLQVTINNFSTFHFRDIIYTGAVVLQRSIGKKIVDGKPGDLQLRRK